MFANPCFRTLKSISVNASKKYQNYNVEWEKSKVQKDIHNRHFILIVYKPYKIKLYVMDAYTCKKLKKKHRGKKTSINFRTPDTSGERRKSDE